MNIAVLVSGNGSNLQALIDACDSGQLAANIALVVSNRSDAYGLERAAQAGIASVVLKHQDYDSREAFDAALLAALQPCAIELVVLAGFMRILSPVFIDSYNGRLLNIHPSLLPLYPGLNTHARALAAGDAEAGSTVHFVTRELDGGPPVLQASVPILPGDDESSLAARVLECEHHIYPLAVSWFVEGRLALQGNQALLDGEVIAASGISLRD